jgi:hypothetical protein
MPAEHRGPRRYRNRSIQLLRVEPANKVTRYYIDNKRVTEAAFEEAKLNRRQDNFCTQTKDGVTRHWSRVRWTEDAPC